LFFCETVDEPASSGIAMTIIMANMPCLKGSLCASVLQYYWISNGDSVRPDFGAFSLRSFFGH